MKMPLCLYFLCILPSTTSVKTPFPTHGKQSLLEKKREKTEGVIL
jgi:hypothetical protein